MATEFPNFFPNYTPAPTGAGDPFIPPPLPEVVTIVPPSTNPPGPFGTGGSASLIPAPLPQVVTIVPPPTGGPAPVVANMVPAAPLPNTADLCVNPLLTQKQTYEIFRIQDGNTDAVFAQFTAPNIIS